MNNSELDKLLLLASVPEREPGYWEQFPKQVTAQLRQRDKASHAAIPARSWPRFSLAVGLSLAAACICIGFVFGFWRGRDSHPSMQQLAQMRKYFQEVATMFPNQVQAIVFDEKGAQLVLSDTPNVPSSVPVFISIAQDHHTRRVITFSGQKIRVNGDTCEVLVSAEGQVLLVGPKWYWSSAEPGNDHAPYQIHAQTLEAVL